MAEQRDLGSSDYVAAEAIGEPGQRRFRLKVLGDGAESASLWLEKEQLNALGEAIENILRNESYQYQRAPLDDLGPVPVFPLSATIDIPVAQMSMGINREQEQVVVVASNGDPDDDSTLAVTFAFGYRQAYELRREIAATVAAGRKPCPLCSAPMDPAGHVCVRSNGHHPH